MQYATLYVEGIQCYAPEHVLLQSATILVLQKCAIVRWLFYTAMQLINMDRSALAGITLVCIRSYPACVPAMSVIGCCTQPFVCSVDISLSC